jgi:hypothetical protein
MFSSGCAASLNSVVIIEFSNSKIASIVSSRAFDKVCNRAIIEGTSSTLCLGKIQASTRPIQSLRRNRRDGVFFSHLLKVSWGISSILSLVVRGRGGLGVRVGVKSRVKLLFRIRVRVRVRVRELPYVQDEVPQPFFC